MLNRRLPLHGLIAVLLALAVQLGVSASVPKIDPLIRIISLETICHAASDGAAHDTPASPSIPDCVLCPLCLIAHVGPLIALPLGPILRLPRVVQILRPELPPPSTAPPNRLARPFQPRAPPAFS
jgi:hypothetical protein